VLGIFRVHGLALIRRFLLAERDLLTFPDLPALSAQIRGAHAALQVRLRPVRKRGVRPATARGLLDGLRGRTLYDTRHDANLTPMELRAPNAIMPQ
jgi:hypothetical protein